MKIIDKLAWIEIQNNKILSTRSFGKDKWYIPGGKREGSESDIAALTREIKEELDVELVQNSIQYLETFQGQAHSHPQGVLVKMTCFTAQYEGALKPSAEVEEIAWLTLKDMHTISPVDKIIFDWLSEKGLIQ